MFIIQPTPSTGGNHNIVLPDPTIVRVCAVQLCFPHKTTTYFKFIPNSLRKSTSLAPIRSTVPMNCLRALGPMVGRPCCCIYNRDSCWKVLGFIWCCFYHRCSVCLCSRISVNNLLILLVVVVVTANKHRTERYMDVYLGALCIQTDSMSKCNFESLDILIQCMGPQDLYVLIALCAYCTRSVANYHLCLFRTLSIQFSLFAVFLVDSIIHIRCVQNMHYTQLLCAR